MTTQPTNSIELPKPPYCAVCGMKTNSRLNISWGRSIVVLCGGHDMNDLRDVARGADTSAKDNSIDSELEEILTRGFNAFYDYITEKDIIKAAHEYNEKTFYFEALQDIHAKYVSRKEIEEAIPALKRRIDYNSTNMGELGVFIRTEYANNFINDFRAKLLPPTKGGNDEA